MQISPKKEKGVATTQQLLQGFHRLWPFLFLGGIFMAAEFDAAVAAWAQELSKTTFSKKHKPRTRNRHGGMPPLACRADIPEHIVEVPQSFATTHHSHIKCSELHATPY